MECKHKTLVSDNLRREEVRPNGGSLACLLKTGDYISLGSFCLTAFIVSVTLAVVFSSNLLVASADAEVFLPAALSYAEDGSYTNSLWSEAINLNEEGKTLYNYHGPLFPLLLGSLFSPSDYRDLGVRLGLFRACGFLFACAGILVVCLRSGKIPGFKEWLCLFLALGGAVSAKIGRPEDIAAFILAAAALAVAARNKLLFSSLFVGLTLFAVAAVHPLGGLIVAILYCGMLFYTEEKTSKIFETVFKVGLLAAFAFFTAFILYPISLSEWFHGFSIAGKHAVMVVSADDAGMYSKRLPVAIFLFLMFAILANWTVQQSGSLKRLLIGLSLCGAGIAILFYFSAWKPRMYNVVLVFPAFAVALSYILPCQKWLGRKFVYPLVFLATANFALLLNAAGSYIWADQKKVIAHTSSATQRFFSGQLLLWMDKGDGLVGTNDLRETDGRGALYIVQAQSNEAREAVKNPALVLIRGAEPPALWRRLPFGLNHLYRGAAPMIFSSSSERKVGADPRTPKPQSNFSPIEPIN